MKVFCPDCGSQIAAADLNLETLLARCRKCDSVFSFADAARTETSIGAARVSGRELTTLPCPPRIHTEDTGSVWTAHWRWFSPTIIFLIFFCIAWDSFLIFWYSIAFTKNGPWLMVVFPVAHVAIGVSLTYFTIASLFNTTTVQATRSLLTVQSGPVPWFGNRSLPAVSVRQIFSRMTTNNQNRSFNNGTNLSYGVFAVLDDGRTVRLVGGLMDSAEAFYLQQQLEKHLNVRPSPLNAMA